MPEKSPDSSQEKRESKKEADYNKVERIKENLMKLEKSVVDVIDEGTQSARGAIQAMGFGITPVSDDDEEDDQKNIAQKKK
jgi:hypothetical protein